MDTIDALIMGIVQGLAEYLPISSSGHLEICREVLGLNLPGDKALEFTLILHVATVLSTIVVLWHEFAGLCTSFFTFRNDERTRYVWKILLSCIPVAIVGFFFKDTVEQYFGNGLLTVGVCLCLTAALLAFAHFYRRQPRASVRQIEYSGHEITWYDSFIIGCAQAVAVLPGLSRSGCTIATGLLLGDRRDQLAQFSFFMVIIPILGEGLLELKDLLSGEVVSEVSVGLTQMAVGFVASFIVGCLACKWMINLVKRGKLVWFAIYCLVMGIVCIIW